jgi:predicted alpha/beta superfamily hydrolase
VAASSFTRSAGPFSGGESFRRFLEQELVPYVDQEFSTSSYRIYCGYSFTGLSVIDELLDERSVFDALLMIDPSWCWDDYEMEKRASAELKGRKFNADVFLSGISANVAGVVQRASEIGISV